MSLCHMFQLQDLERFREAKLTFMFFSNLQDYHSLCSDSFRNNGSLPFFLCKQKCNLCSELSSTFNFLW